MVSGGQDAGHYTMRASDSLGRFLTEDMLWPHASPEKGGG